VNNLLEGCTHIAGARGLTAVLWRTGTIEKAAMAATKSSEEESGMPMNWSANTSWVPFAIEMQGDGS
jgi:hypothetical protein